MSAHKGAWRLKPRLEGLAATKSACADWRHAGYSKPCRWVLSIAAVAWSPPPMLQSCR